MSKHERELSPLTNLKRRFDKNPGLYASPKAREAIEDAVTREMALMKAKISRLFDARLAELEQLLTAAKERKK